MWWSKILIPLFKLLFFGAQKFTDARASFTPSVPSTDKEIALKYIFQFVGQWYKWGGDDPSGFDCSGLAIEYLKSFGRVPRQYDGTAQSLWEQFKDCRVTAPTRGCLVFWKDASGKMIHVEIMLNERLAIGSSGGGSSTKTVQEEIEQNAFIKVRDINSRASIGGYIDPFKGG